MADEHVLHKLKSQILEIEENYVRQEDINGKYVTVDEIDAYLKRDEFTSRYDFISDVLDGLRDLVLDKVDTSVLDEYVRKEDLSSLPTGEVTEEWVKETITSTVDSQIASISDHFINRIEQLQDTYLSSVDNRVDGLKSTVLDAVMESFSGYVKSDELDALLEELGYTKGSVFYEYVQNYVNKRLANIDGLSRDELADFVTRDDIPTRTSQLVNDSGYLTKHQDLSGYARRSELASYVTPTQLTQQLDTRMSDAYKNLASKTELGQYIKTDEAVSMFMLKTDKPNMNGYVKTSDLTSYAKKTDLPRFDEFALKSNLPKMEDYVRYDELNDLDLVRTSNLPDFDEFPTYKTLDAYLLTKDFTKYQDEIENRGYINMSDLKDYLLEYPRKSDITSFAIDETSVKQLIEDAISTIKVPEKVSDLYNDAGYLTTHQNISNLVHRDEIRKFITIEDLDNKFLKVDDFVLPDDLVYQDDIKDFVVKTDFEKLMSSVAYKQQFDNYLLSSEFEKKMSKLTSSFDKEYVGKTEFDKAISDLMGLEDKTNHFLTQPDLEPYVRKDELDDFSTFEKYLDTKYIMTDEMKTFYKKMGSEIDSQKSWVDEYFLKKSDVDKLTKYEVTVSDPVMSNYYTKTDINLRFLSKEDYRGIKRAATLNFDYNDYPDLFFSVLNNQDDIKMNDGFYIVDEKAYIIRHNRIVPVADRRDPHWEIETSDEDWKDKE